jgi:hypothetical protein
MPRSAAEPMLLLRSASACEPRTRATPCHAGRADAPRDRRAADDADGMLVFSAAHATTVAIGRARDDEERVELVGRPEAARQLFAPRLERAARSSGGAISERKKPPC